MEWDWSASSRGVIRAAWHLWYDGTFLGRTGAEIMRSRELRPSNISRAAASETLVFLSSVGVRGVSTCS